MQQDGEIMQQVDHQQQENQTQIKPDQDQQQPTAQQEHVQPTGTVAQDFGKTDKTIQFGVGSAIPVIESRAIKTDCIKHNITKMNVPFELNIAENDELSRRIFIRKYLGNNRKKPSVRAKERRLRQNKRLRKVLVPKNALMAIHELPGIKIGDFNVVSKTGGGFICHVTVNNIQYEGFGISKTNAKCNACEKALRDLFISKMLQKPSLRSPSTEKLDSVDAEAPKDSVNEDIDMKSESADEDDLPMINLASYALYKLFTEWENEGFEIPEFRSNLSMNQQPPSTQKTPTIRTELPPGWESMHPAMLLCMMRPGSSYSDLGTEGVLPNLIQRVEITIDGEDFIGTGRSKKSARKDAAINACNKLFGTSFTKDP